MIHPDLLDPEKYHDNGDSSTQDIGEASTMDEYDVDSLALDDTIHLPPRAWHKTASLRPPVWLTGQPYTTPLVTSVMMD